MQEDEDVGVGGKGERANSVEVEKGVTDEKRKRGRGEIA